MTRSSLGTLYIALGIALAPVGILSINGMMSNLGESNLAHSIVVLPLILLSITAFLGWKMDQLSIVFSALVYVGAFILIKTPIEAVHPEAKWRALAVTVPISLLFIFLINASRFGSRNWPAFISSFILPMGLFLVLIKYRLPEVQNILSWKISNINGWWLSDFCVILAQIYAVTLFKQKDKEVRRYAFTTFLCLFPLYWLLNETAAPGRYHYLTFSSGVIFSGIGCALLYSMYRMYWQKIYIDELTELPNRRALEVAMKRVGKVYTIAMVDIDHFKKFNDTYGHDEGDNVLRFVAFHLARTSNRKAFRYGGEEFCLVYDKKMADEVYSAVDKIRASLEKKDFYIRAPKHVRAQTSSKDRAGNPRGAPKVKVTISVGLASPSGSEMTSDEVRTAADRSLYKSKSEGRNTVTLWLGEDVEELHRVRNS